MILINYINTAGYLPLARFNQLLNTLPPSFAHKTLAYKQWQDRYLSLLGKLLLMRALGEFGFDKSKMAEIVYNEYGKPYLQEDDVHFNISHSGHYVVCAMSNESPIGIDIEQVKQIGFDDFRNTMTAAQWNLIEASGNPLATFYHYWTCKESVLKADSRGLSIPLTAILIEGEMATCLRKLWFINRLALDERYMACMATAILPQQVSIKCLNYDDL